MFVSVISPVHNEEACLEELVARVGATLAAMPLRGWEHLLVDDASTDQSPQILRRLARVDPEHVRVFRHARRQGQGGAQRTGFFFARGEVFVTLDADLQLFPEDLPLVLRPVLEQGCDIVATRVQGPRSLVSRLGNLFMKLLLQSPVRDASTKFMALKADFVRGMPMVGNDQRYVLAIAQSRGARRVTEVEVRYQPRRHGVSKYSLWKKVFQGIPEMLAVRSRIARGFYARTLCEEEIRSGLDPAF
jgi:glycosyltransferase involved in cell wall biosynthesis